MTSPTRYTIFPKSSLSANKLKFALAPPVAGRHGRMAYPYDVASIYGSILHTLMLTCREAVHLASRGHRLFISIPPGVRCLFYHFTPMNICRLDLNNSPIDIFSHLADTTTKPPITLTNSLSSVIGSGTA